MRPDQTLKILTLTQKKSGEKSSIFCPNECMNECTNECIQDTRKIFCMLSFEFYRSIRAKKLGDSFVVEKYESLHLTKNDVSRQGEGGLTGMERRNVVERTMR